jgi:hypothetical protein
VCSSDLAANSLEFNSHKRTLFLEPSTILPLLASVDYQSATPIARIAAYPSYRRPAVNL